MPAPPVDAAINDAFVANLLTMRATVYGRAANGRYEAVLRSGLACSLDPAIRQSGATNATRAELANLATLSWDAEFDLPENAQVEVDAYPGRRWTVKPGTMWPDILPGIGIIGRSCDVVRAI